MKRPVLIAKAWPYANGPLHLGHIAGLLPADVLARYFRLNGDDVLFVSGTDCHGTPILNTAIDEGREPAEIADFYHSQFDESFKRLGFTHDLYSKTHRPEHSAIVQQFLLNLLNKKYLIELETPQLYCAQCRRFLVDRYVEGNCPECGAASARGDQCESCGATYEAIKLANPICKQCHSPAIISHSKHLHLNLPMLQAQLTEWSAQAKANWRNNARTTTEAWLAKGLVARAITRDISWGVPLPPEIANYEQKVIYVWFEAVLGYLTASIIHCGGNLEQGPWEKWWRPENKPLHYYIHGKDNIPFHTIIWPAMLLGFGDLALATHIISSEYLQLPSGKKFSKSSKYGATIPEYLELIDEVAGLTIDSLRFFLIYKNPEEKDSQFSWTEIVKAHNAELVNTLGNLANRTVVLIQKNFNNEVPTVSDVLAVWQTTPILHEVEDAFQKIRTSLERGNLRDAVEIWLALTRQANKYIDERKPWQQIKDDEKAARATLYVLIQVIANLMIMIEPMIPAASAKLKKLLNATTPLSWASTMLPCGHKLGDAEYLFTRIKREHLPPD